MELSLVDLRNGETGIITFIGVDRRNKARSGWRFQKRLEDMGLTPGTMVTVIKSAPFKGPLEVAVRGSTIAIGRGMARRIFVEVTR